MSHELQNAASSTEKPTKSPKHLGSNASPPIIQSWHDVYDQDPERDGKFLCQNVLRETREVDARFVPDFTPTFGVLDKRIENERNARRSKLTYLYLDTDNLFTPQIKKRALNELGAVDTTTTIEVVDATAGLPAPTADGLLVLESTTTQYDRAHGVRETVNASSWAELKTKIATDPEAGGNRTVESKQVVAPGTAVPTGSDVVSARLEELSPTKAMLVVKRAPDGFRQKLSKLYTDNAGLGCQTQIIEEVKDPGFVPPAMDYLTVSQELLDQGNGKLLFRKKTVTQWPIFIDAEEEPETGIKVTIRKEILDVATLPAFVSGEARKVKTLKNLDCKKALLITREIDATILSHTEIEWHNVSYYFPAYLQPDLPFSVEELVGTGSSIIATNRASDHTFKIPCRFEITYHSTLPIVDEVFQFKPVDLRVSSINVNITENDVLVDGGVLTFREDYQNLSYNIPGSSPTATEYLEMMENEEEVLISDDVTRWKYNLWKRIKVYLKIPDISQTLGGYLSY